jgi:hypothetical protein
MATCSVSLTRPHAGKKAPFQDWQLLNPDRSKLSQEGREFCGAVENQWQGKVDFENYLFLIVA